MINRDRLVNTFMDIVRIDSVSGEEDEIAEDLSRRLDALGLSVEVDGYGNLIANPPDLDPDGGEIPLLLSVHMDTVEPGRGIQPRVDDDVIRSDGTTIVGGDAKAGVAAVLEAIESLKEDGTSHLPYQGGAHQRGGDRPARRSQPGLQQDPCQGSRRVRRRGTGKHRHGCGTHIRRIHRGDHRESSTRRGRTREGNLRHQGGSRADNAGCPRAG